MAGLNDGSGNPNAPRKVVDFTVAGLATRVVSEAPTDADWGAYPPPNGTIVIEGRGDYTDGGNFVTLWIRLNGTWRSAVLDLT